MCQTVYDTIRTVVYDTVHTSVFDTVHTVSFDTVHSLVYDSAAVTLQALRDSQQFYSEKFGALLTVFTIFVAIIAVIVGYKFYLDRKGLSNEIAKATEKVKAEFDTRFKNQQKFVNELRSMTADLRESVIASIFTQAKMAEHDNKTRLFLFRLVLTEICLHFDKSFLNHTLEAVTMISAVWESALEQGSPKNGIPVLIDVLKSVETLVTGCKLDENESVARTEREQIQKILTASSNLRTSLNAFVTGKN